MAYPKQVQEIHHEFLTASDKLLASAKEVLCEKNVIEKAERLKKVGFTNSVEVGRVEKTKVTREIADLIQHYSVRYPDNKFITEEQVSAICKKYKLVCGPVERFTGFVPDSKLKQIEGFLLNHSDKKEDVIVVKEWSSKNSPEVMQLNRMFPSGIPAKYCDNDSVHLNHIPGIISSRGFVYFSVASRVDVNARIICAPSKDMDLKGLLKIGALFASITTVHVPDPVVLQPVKGGFLILAAWGDEASDELVVNANHN